MTESATLTPRAVPPAHPARHLAVAVLSDNELAQVAAAAYLATRRELAVVGPEHPSAEVLVVFAGAVDDEVLDRVEEVALAREGRPLRLLLVAEAMHEHRLWRAVSLGLIGVVPRRSVGWDRVVGALLAARGGRGEMPPAATGWLLDQVRTLQSLVLEPAGMTVAGLSVREVEVLRLLADGLDTVEVAAELNYSERTIKNIVHGMMTRLGLRNRSHAVAYAMRAGAF